MLISVLDQVPARTGSSSPEAFGETLALAAHLDRLGFHRYWVAEHHALGSLSNSAPEVLIGHLAGVTSRMRLGSGGILLPNHRPIHVAEQFQVLEALHPGRIDLGIGRSEGALDPATVEAFARDDDFDTQLDHLLAFGGRRPLPDGDPMSGVRATPPDVLLPPVTLLGSSLSSAENAARRGLPYGFAAHTNTQQAAEALRLYRDRFQPAAPGDRPHATLALKVVVGESLEHAEQLAAPWTLSMARLRAGLPAPLGSVEDALAHTWTQQETAAMEKIDLRADVVGDLDAVRAGLAAHRDLSGCDEVIALTNTPDPGERRRSYERLAELTTA